MKKLLLSATISLFLLSFQNSYSQELKRLTLDDVIKLSEEQSPNALMAKQVPCKLLAISYIQGRIQAFPDTYRNDPVLQHSI
jgi:hypothetical protein